MVHPTAVREVPAMLERETEGRDLLYKADHPRAVDQVIDFFGDGAVRDIACDRCGELFIESLA
jgi:hypothetical protein